MEEGDQRRQGRPAIVENWNGRCHISTLLEHVSEYLLGPYGHWLRNPDTNSPGSWDQYLCSLWRCRHSYALHTPVHLRRAVLGLCRMCLCVRLGDMFFLVLELWRCDPTEEKVLPDRRISTESSLANTHGMASRRTRVLVQADFLG